MILQSFSNPFGASKITDTKTNIEHLYVQATQNDQTQFYIDLDTFDPSVDIVHVQSNGLSLFPGEDFTINGNYIVLAEGVPAGRDIGIYIFQNFLTNSKGEILNGLESKLEVVPIQLVATEEGQTYFPIDISYDPNKDFIKVDSGITSLFPGEDYEVGTNGITLVEGVPIGRTIGIYIYKNVILPKGQMQIHGSLIMEKSIPLDRLVDTVSTGTNSQTKIFPLQVVASIDNQTVFPIELDTFDAETDFAFVQSGVTNLFYGADFTIQNKNIILTEGVPAGRTLGIYVLKNVAQTNKENYVSGANLTPGSVTPDKIGGVLPIEKGGTGAATADEALAKLGGSKPNLLDNWYFGNPVNQNGKTEYTGAYVCTIDRWNIGNYPTASVSLGNSGLLLSGYKWLIQPGYNNAWLIGKLITGSVLTGEGELYTGTITVPESGNPSFVSIKDGVCYLGLVINESSVDARLVNFGETDEIIIKAVKLELGSEQTLAHQDESGNWVLNEIPNYAEQMAICKQYSPTTGEYIGLAYNQIGASNPNLLDNWYFANPINQRDGYLIPPGVPYYVYDGAQVGTTDKYYKVDNITGNLAWITINGTQYVANQSLKVKGYVGTDYTIDRWVFSTDDTLGNVSLTSGGISFIANGTYANFEQRTEPIIFEKDRVYTLSFLCADTSKINQVYQCTYKDGNNYYGTGIRGYRDNNLYSLTFTPSTSGSESGVSFCGVQAINGEQLTVIAAKLEYGSQQTLVRKENGIWVLNDPPPNRQQELAKCQRYCHRMFLRVPPGKSYISFPVQFRATPTIYLIQSEDGFTTFENGNVTNNGCIINNADPTYTRTYEAIFSADL